MNSVLSWFLLPYLFASAEKLEPCKARTYIFPSFEREGERFLDAKSRKSVEVLLAINLAATWTGEVSEGEQCGRACKERGQTRRRKKWKQGGSWGLGGEIKEEEEGLVGMS